MKEADIKRRSIQLLYVLAIILVGGVLAYGLVRSYRLYLVYATGSISRAEVEKKLLELHGREAALYNALERIETKKGVEAVLRSKYDLIKQGETEFVFVRNDAKATSTDVQVPFSRKLNSILRFVGQ